MFLIKFKVYQKNLKYVKNYKYHTFEKKKFKLRYFSIRHKKLNKYFKQFYTVVYFNFPFTQTNLKINYLFTESKKIYNTKILPPIKQK